MNVDSELITTDELKSLFGDAIPMEAMAVLFPEHFVKDGEVPHFEPIHVVREKLKAIASRGKLEWPERLTLRDTKVYADEGQRIFTTATGYGYEKQEYVRADVAATLPRQEAEAGPIEPAGLFWRWASDDKWRTLGKLSDAALADFVRDQGKIAPVVVAPLFASPSVPEAKVVSGVTEALKPFSDFAGVLFSLNRNASEPFYSMVDQDGNAAHLSVGDFFKARAALTAALSVVEPVQQEGVDRHEKPRDLNDAITNMLDEHELSQVLQDSLHEDIAQLIWSTLNAGGNYIADHDTFPKEVHFANGRVVKLSANGAYLIVTTEPLPTPPSSGGVK